MEVRHREWHRGWTLREHACGASVSVRDGKGRLPGNGRRQDSGKTCLSATAPEMATIGASWTAAETAGESAGRVVLWERDRWVRETCDDA